MLRRLLALSAGLVLLTTEAAAGDRVGSRLLHMSRPTAEGARALTVQAWYPASGSGPAASYAPDSGLMDLLVAEGYMDLSADLLNGWRERRVQAVMDAPAAPGAYPTVFLSPGFGMSRINYSDLAESLARAGYVVLSIDHPDVGYSVTGDGAPVKPAQQDEAATTASVESMAVDMGFILSELEAGRHDADLGRAIDEGRVGAIGHSLGGAAALEACRTQAWARACVDLDGDPWGVFDQAGADKPFLVLLHQPDWTAEQMAARNMSPEAGARRGRQRDEAWARRANMNAAPGLILKIKGFNHYSFSDFPFLVAPSLMQRMGGTIGADRGREIYTRLSIGFFDEVLLSRSEALDAAIHAAPEAAVSAANPAGRALAGL